MEATEIKEVFVMHFFCLGITQNVSFFCFLRDRQSNGESGDGSKAKESVLFFIYTPVITISLASKQVRRIDLSCSLSLFFPTVVLSVLYLL